MTSLAHPREARLRQRREFTRAHEVGTRTHGRFVTLIVVENTVGRARLGCAVGRRVGNAVVRNRLRRLLREIFRHHAGGWPAVDLVVIGKPELAGFVDTPLVELERELMPQIGRAIAKARRSR